MLASRTPGVGDPICGFSSTRPIAASTAARNSSPRPRRCSSYQRAASAISASASSLIRSGSFNAFLARSLFGREPQATAFLGHPRIAPAALAVQSRWPKQPRHRRRVLRPSLRSTPPPVLLAPPIRASKRLREASHLTCSCRASYLDGRRPTRRCSCHGGLGHTDRWYSLASTSGAVVLAVSARPGAEH